MSERRSYFWVIPERYEGQGRRDQRLSGGVAIVTKPRSRGKVPEKSARRFRCGPPAASDWRGQTGALAISGPKGRQRNRPRKPKLLMALARGEVPLPAATQALTADGSPGYLFATGGPHRYDVVVGPLRERPNRVQRRRPNRLPGEIIPLRSARVVHLAPGLRRVVVPDGLTDEVVVSHDGIASPIVAGGPVRRLGVGPEFGRQDRKPRGPSRSDLFG